MQKNLECSCIKQSGRVKEAKLIHRPSDGYSVESIETLLKNAGAELPPKEFSDQCTINASALAVMLGNRNLRTKIGRLVQGEAGERLTASVGICQACLKENQQRVVPTPEMIMERHHYDIQKTLEKHPDVESAEVSAWVSTTANGRVQKKVAPVTLFSATLTLTNGIVLPFAATLPRHNLVVERNDGKVVEFHGKKALWSRIRRRDFIGTEIDPEIANIKLENERQAFEQEVRTRYATNRNIAEECLQVRLLTAKDVVPEAREAFSRQCGEDRKRYLCEVTTLLPGLKHGLSGTVVQTEHVSLRNLIDFPSKRNCFDEFRDQFIELQRRYVLPISDLGWHMDDYHHEGKARRKVYFKVSNGTRSGGHPWEVHRSANIPPNGLRYFNEISGEQKYLSLVEVSDQQTGQKELKWCLTQDRCLKDKQGKRIPHDDNNLYSIICRYKEDAGTAHKVKQGGKRYYRVNEVIAYVHGPSEIIQKLDTLVKRMTIDHQCPPVERDGKTEFRYNQAKDQCLEALTTITPESGVKIMTPESASTIPWDLLQGPECWNPREWIFGRLRNRVLAEKDSAAAQR